METLTPVQRVAVITIGLTLTAVVVVLVLPWVGEQIVNLLPATATPVLATATSSPTMTSTPAYPTGTPTPRLTPTSTASLSEPRSLVFPSPGSSGRA